MGEIDSGNLQRMLERIKLQAAGADYRVTQHADQETVEDGISLDEVLEAIQEAEILEDYPEHRRGACCLLGGLTRKGPPLHIVCTTAQPRLILITVYEPRPPKWATRRTRGKLL